MTRYERRRVRWALIVAAGASIALSALAIADLQTFVTHPNPLADQATGMPDLSEPPPDGALPWILDSRGRWPVEARTDQGRGILRERYPVWSRVDETPDVVGDQDGALVLERIGSGELAIEARGLVVRVAR